VTVTPPSPAAADPASPSARPLRADARRNRERILQAAREVFARDGIDAQMDEVAERAEVGVGTVYRHFPTKDALMVELVRAKFRSMAEIARRAGEREGEPFEVFAGLLQEVAEVFARDAVAIQAFSGSAEDVWAQARDEQSALLEVVAPILARAHAAGTLSPVVTLGDIPMLMCGVSATMGQERAGFSWRRHLDLLIELMRA
jgi:AcrR family transcriptional regulator